MKVFETWEFPDVDDEISTDELRFSEQVNLNEDNPIRELIESN